MTNEIRIGEITVNVRYVPSEALVAAIRSLIGRARDEGCDEAACIVAEEWLKERT